MNDFQVALSGTEAMHMSMVSQIHITKYLPKCFTHSKNTPLQFLVQDLGAIHRTFHGYRFRMHVWPQTVEIRKNMDGLIVFASH
jgi:hypothetical protein